MKIYPLIMCGGPGARLWPASTARRPKPFIDLLGGESLFQKTVRRLAGMAGAQPAAVITGAAHADVVRHQLAEIARQGTILAEPAARDSGPALFAAVAWIARQDPQAIIVAVASDHHIPDDGAFAAAVAAAVPAAELGEIITFGVAPAEPSTAYGYIRPGPPLPGAGAVRRVEAFVEKPDAARARDLVAAGCLWNSGNFMFRADAFLAEAELYAPAMLATVVQALDQADDHAGVVRLGPVFRKAEKISVDFAVMEKTRRAAVLPIRYAWSDLGSWDAIWAASARDAAGNAISGLAVARDSHGCLIRAEAGTEIIALGLKNLAVIARDGHVLVSDLGDVAALKPALEALARRRAATTVAAAPDIAAELDAAVARLRRWLWRDALPTWWCFGADHQNGGFHESLNLDLTPTSADRRTRVQARQTFVYATAGLHGWPGPWQAAMTHGLKYLLDRFARPDGLFRALVGLDGAPLDDDAVLYDQAFALLAMAAVARVAPDRAADLETRSRRTVEAVRRAFGHPAGGFRGREDAEAFLLDPIMHLFEAALAWRDVADDPFWNTLADDLGELFLTKLYDPASGSVREVFDAAWRPAPGPAGRELRPGHHFEWAWLLDKWTSRRARAGAAAAARALMAAGARGVDAAGGLVVDVLSDDFSVAESSSRLWPQTERLRAEMSFAARRDGVATDRRAAALQAALAMERYFDTPIAGLWRDAPTAGPVAAPAPASSLYHIVGAVLAARDGSLAQC